MSQEVDELLGRLESKVGFIGALVINKDGIAIKSTMGNEETTQYAGLMSKIAEEAYNDVATMDPENELRYVRLRSIDFEILIMPEKDYVLVLIQRPVD